MDEPAKPVAAADRGLMSRAERNHMRRGLGRSQIERSLLALAVVVVDVLVQDTLELEESESKGEDDAKAEGDEGAEA